MHDPNGQIPSQIDDINRNKITPPWYNYTSKILTTNGAVRTTPVFNRWRFPAVKSEPELVTVQKSAVLKIVSLIWKVV
jgi:hypothetical protein